jgi:acyl-CoA hydrolase
MANLNPKHARESEVVTRYLLMPRDVNQHGTAFGGLIMELIDGTASMAASRHSERLVVTASIDSLSFLLPIRVGEHVVLRARVSYTGKSSMEVSVRVEKENPVTREKALATTAYLTFVALDENGKPRAVPPLLCETDEEKHAFERTRERVAARREMRCKHDDFEVCE